ncbi:MAG: polysaccharide biosynthesis/export family protein [Pyrinomonadaceae bacterium]
MNAVKTLCALTLLLALVALPLGAQQSTGQTPSFSPASAGGPPDIVGPGGSKDYPLGPGDVVELRVFGEAQFDGSYDVDDEGKLIIPFIEQPLDARCRHINQIRKDIVTALAKFIRSPQVYLRVKEQRSRRPAVVYGAVRAPTQFPMHRRARLLELLSNSGGVTDQNNGTIQITHTEQSVCQEPDEIGDATSGVQGMESAATLPFTVYKVAELKQGKPEANPFIRPGDIVYVAEAAPIYVIGAVTSPQGVYLRPGLTLTRALAMVGGIRKDAKTSEVRIYHQKEGSVDNAPAFIADFRKIQRNQIPDVVLQPYDVIEVPEKGTSAKDVLIGLIKTAGNTAAQGAGYRVIPIY